MIGTDCVFCKILNREISATIICEDADTLAFLDVHPINVGHTLVVPRQHFSDLYALPEEIIGRLFTEVKKIAIALKQSLTADGINIGMNNGVAAGQLVPHAHIHVIPRFVSDGFVHWKSRQSYKDGEAEAIAKKIKAQLK